MLEARVEKAIGILNARAAPIDETGTSYTEKGPALDSNQKFHCRPRNLADYTKRLESFTSITKWFAKPDEVGPLECARFGWVLADVDMLQCESCHSRLMFKASPSATSADLRALAERFKTELNASHKPLCPWRDNPSPQSFASCYPIVSSRNEALSAFDSALRSFLPADEHSLALARDFIEEHNFQPSGELREENLECAAARVLSDAELDGEVVSNRYWRNAVICALFGWTRDERLSVLTCATCKRRVGVWNLLNVSASIARDNVASEDSVASPAPSSSPVPAAIAQEKATGPLSPQHKKTKVGANYFHPAKEHRWFCPWTTGSHVGWKALVQLLTTEPAETTPRVGPVTAVLQGLHALS